MITGSEEIQGVPNPETSQADALDSREADREAKQIAEAHRKRKQNRRQVDLTREKYLVWIDGENDGQWADIIGGTEVKVPVNLNGGPRFSLNMLQPVCENMVAYHTGQDFEVLAKPKADRESRDRAKIDTIHANGVIRRQKLNQIFAQALMFACGTGHWPVHASWRADLTSDHYEPIYHPPESIPGMVQPRRGFVDAWLGDYFDTVYNEGARRSSVQWLQYGRILPTEQLRQIFARPDLEGGTNVPSVSRMQRILGRWSHLDSMDHGTAAITGEGGDELSACIFREIAPGILRDYPEGRLQIVALQGTAETDEALGGGYGRAVLLHDGPLPGRRFSMVRIYAGYRGDDILGRPYVSNLIDPQGALNQLWTMEIESARRAARPPIKILAGSMVDDTLTTEDDAVMEFLDPQGLQYSQFLHAPPGSVQVFDGPIGRAQEYIFRAAGWQAASRGEGTSGDSGVKVRFLSKADDTIHAPINKGIRDSIAEFCQLSHALATENMVVPDDIRDITGDDLGYLAKPYLDREDLSDEPPEFVTVSGFGATAEDTANKLTALVQMQGADGQPLIPTDKFWKLFPDQTLAPAEVSARDVKEGRTQAINYAIKEVVKDLRNQFQQGASQYLEQAHAMLSQEFEPLPDDIIPMHLEALSVLSQDEDEDPMVRMLARRRQGLYAGAMQASQPTPTAGPSPSPGGQPPQSLPSPTDPSGPEPLDEVQIA